MQNKMKHPRGLMVLFFTEMWERFSYYGMRALLVLYLTSQLVSGGFGMDRATALEIYAIFTGLVYVTPILGGIFADKILGQRKSIFIGGLLMALGQFTLAYTEVAGDLVTRTNWFNLGLGLLIMGNGFFKPNISTIVGRLYDDNDPRKDSGFTIFYMGINVGAFMSPLIAGYLGENIGWAYGFASAGVGMIVGLIWFWAQSHKLGFVGFAPGVVAALRPTNRLNGRDWIDVLAWTLVTTVIVLGVLKGLTQMPGHMKDAMLLAFVVLVTIGLFIIIALNTQGRTQWSRVGAILVFGFFNLIFWAGFEQAGGTMSLFAKEQTLREINFLIDIIPASYFQAINPIAIVAFAPLLSILWVFLSRIGRNPNTPVKFGLGLLLLGAGFVVMSAAAVKADAQGMVSPLWLLSVFLLHTAGELCLSPIGLSMITNLSPPKIVSVMMGFWFYSTALANYMAGILESLLHTLAPGMNVFVFLSITSIGAGVLMVLISPLVTKLMAGVK